jgi:hypothetical protein
MADKNPLAALPQTQPPSSRPSTPLAEMINAIRARFLHTGRGGPSEDELRRLGAQDVERNARLRRQLQMQDPARFRDYRRRGFDPMSDTQEFTPTDAPQAELLSDRLNPAVQMAPNAVRAYSQPVNLADQERSDLIWRSWTSPRGSAQHALNEQQNAELRRRIEHLRNTPVPAEYGDGDFSYRRQMLNNLLWATGQGGGMR